MTIKYCRGYDWGVYHCGDSERHEPDRRAELYAKSGKLLKTATMDGIKKIQGRWFPSRYLFKDELKRNSKGTEWHIDDIQFDVNIPDKRFSKSNLRK